MLRKTLIFLVTVLTLGAHAQTVKESTSYMPWFGAGIFGGSLMPTSDEFKEQGSTFARMGVMGAWHFTSMTAMTFELEGFFPNGGSGFNMGFQQCLLPAAISPFAGGVVGFRYLVADEDRPLKFGDRFGPLAALQGGMLFFRESEFQVRLRAGYEFTANKDKDQAWTADIGMLFAFGRPGIRKLNL